MGIGRHWGGEEGVEGLGWGGWGLLRVGGLLQFEKRSAEDRGVACAHGISVCTGTSGGRRRDCSLAPTLITPTRL